MRVLYLESSLGIELLWLMWREKVSVDGLRTPHLRLGSKIASPTEICVFGHKNFAFC